jgi:hypothetical protein
LDEEANLKAIFIRNEGLQNRLKQEAKVKAIPFNENEDVETEKIRKQILSINHESTRQT